MNEEHKYHAIHPCWAQGGNVFSLFNGCGFILRRTDADNDGGPRFWYAEDDIGIMAAIWRRSQLKVNEFAILDARAEDVGIVVALLKGRGHKFAQ